MTYVRCLDHVGDPCGHPKLKAPSAQILRLPPSHPASVSSHGLAVRCGGPHREYSSPARSQPRALPLTELHCNALELDRGPGACTRPVRHALSAKTLGRRACVSSIEARCAVVMSTTVTADAAGRPSDGYHTKSQTRPLRRCSCSSIGRHCFGRQRVCRPCWPQSHRCT